MNLIAYSDSEESDNETPQVPNTAAKSAPKPAFQKVVDRSNPGKIKLQLPTPSQPRAEKDDIDAEGPPAKKVRTGGGAFGGFNAMLPAPKRPNVNAISAPSGADVSGKRGLGKGLGVGVNLRTGSEAAFRREPKPEEYDENGNPVKRGDGAPMQKEDFRAMLNLPPPKTEKKVEPKAEIRLEEPTSQAEAKPAAPKPRFMPLSVARGRKKKPVAPKPVPIASENGTKSAGISVSSAKAPVVEPKAPAKPKVSLFSVTQEEDAVTSNTSPVDDYQPLLYGADEHGDAEMPDEAFDESSAHQTPHTVQAGPASTSMRQPQNDLTNIASELNLTEAQRRQLFGRKGQGPDLSSANIIEFNTDTEYAHNERLRQQGETVQHNAVRSITGTGKNSMRSLLNVALTQKDALEEHFAAGRRNKKEAGNKYGW